MQARNSPFVAKEVLGFNPRVGSLSRARSCELEVYEQKMEVHWKELIRGLRSWFSGQSICLASLRIRYPDPT